MKDLFRQEVMEANREEWLGTILLATPLSRWVLVLLAASFALALALFFIFGQYTRREMVAGQLIATTSVLTVSAPNAGIISRIEVSDGQAIKAGDAIAELAIYEGEVGVDDPHASAAEGRDAHGGQVRAIHARSDMSSPQSVRVQPIAQDGTTSRVNNIPSHTAQNQSQRIVVLRAPQDGVVSSLSIKSWQTVAAGQSLLSIQPEHPVLQVQLLVPIRAISFIKHGERIALRYEAFPYKKYGQYFGRVSDISRSSLSEQQIASLEKDLPAQAQEPVYLVLVSLDDQFVTIYGKSQPLKAGMLVDANMVVESRTLLEWIFEPIYGAANHIGGSEHA